MSFQPTFYQRIFNRDLFLSSISHPTRTIITRRHHSDRVCLVLSLVMLSYIVWYTVISPTRMVRFQRDPAEELAYRKAINESLPIIQNTQICSLDAIDLFFIIISSSSHFLERQSIRETWGSMPDAFGVHSQRLFIIGYHSGGNFYRDVSNEAAHEEDLLYLTTDDHSNSLKELDAYRWLKKFCPNVKYIFKTEDDLFLNSLLLHELVGELKKEPDNTQNRKLYNAVLDPLFFALKSPGADKFLFGWAYQPGLPERNNTMSPYYITREEYSKEMYPRYCSGFGYLMNSKTRNLLVTESSKDKHPFRFPDIYITGILPERLNFVCETLPFAYHQGTADDCIAIIKKNNKKEPSPSSPPLLICSTGRHIGYNSYSDYYKMWSDLKHIYADRLHPINN